MKLALFRNFQRLSFMKKSYCLINTSFIQAPVACTCKRPKFKSTPTHPPKNNNGKIHLYGKLTMFFIVKIALYIAVAMPRNSSLLKDALTSLANYIWHF